MSQKRSSYLKRLFRDFAHHPGLLILASIGTIAQVALTVWLPILIGHAVDLVINPQGVKVLLPVLIQMVLIILANTLIQWINPLLYNQLVYRFSQNLRAEVMEKVHRLPLSYLDKQGSGDFVSRLTTDVEQLNSGLLMVFNQFFVGLLTNHSCDHRDHGRAGFLYDGSGSGLDPFILGDCSFYCQAFLYTFPRADQGAGPANSVDRRVVDARKFDPVF